MVNNPPQIIRTKDRTLVLGGRPVPNVGEGSYPYEYIANNDRIFVRYDAFENAKLTNRNVLAFSRSGDLLWQIQASIPDQQGQDHYVHFSWNPQRRKVGLITWSGVHYLVDEDDGSVELIRGKGPIDSLPPPFQEVNIFGRELSVGGKKVQNLGPGTFPVKSIEHGGRLFVLYEGEFGTKLSNRNILAFSLAGDLLWQVQAPEPEEHYSGFGWSWDEKRICVFTQSGNAFLLNEDDGAVQRRAQT